MLSDFLKYQAQTTPNPLGMEISHAKGSYIYDTAGNEHLDFVAGVSACTLGHGHPKVVQAVKDQMNKYAHVMVYGGICPTTSGSIVQIAGRKASGTIGYHLPRQ